MIPLGRIALYDTTQCAYGVLSARIEADKRALWEVVTEIGAAHVNWHSSRQKAVNELLGPIVRPGVVLEHDAVAEGCQGLPLVADWPQPATEKFCDT